MLQINASIAKHRERIWCAYRTRHLYQHNAECFLTELNSELVPISTKKLIAENNNTAFEDIRLFSFGDKLLGFYTYFPFDQNGGWKWEYGVGYGEIDEVSGIIKKQISLRGLSKRVHEKNWSPYMYKNELFMITDLEPYLRVIRIDEKNGAEEVYLSSEKTEGWVFGELRGGSPLISEPGDINGWLYGFVHSYQSHQNGFTRYYHYTIIRFDHLRKVFEYSPLPLPYLDEQPDEEYELLWKYSNNRELKVIFPMGIMYHDDGVLVSFGKDDVSSYTEYFSWDRVKSFFNNH
jgi:hypothetical protein